MEKIVESPEDLVDYQIRDGQIFKYQSTPDQPHDTRFDWKLIPAPSERLRILRECHDESLHPGIDKTLARIRQRFFWPRMVLEVREYVQKCSTCKEIKAPNTALAPPMGDQRIASHPWQIIALDFIGPLPRSKRQNQYILSVVDLFSKWVMLVPFRKIDSSVLCAVLRDQWFFRNSIPEVVISDNATCFLSRQFRDLLLQFDVRHWLNAKYHSQANPVERVNRTVNAAIRSYVKTDQRLWDARLSEIETTINSSPHSATNLTPYFSTHGYEMFASGYDHNLDEPEPTLSPEERSARQREMFGNICEFVQKNLKKAHEEGKNATICDIEVIVNPMK